MIYRLINADVMDGLRSRPEGSAQTCITSPPYWGLRDYGIEPSVWGGEPEHAHKWGSGIRRTGGARGQGSSDKFGNLPKVIAKAAADSCQCGAWRGCLGLEPTPELFVRHIVLVFREVWRVLRDDGTLWINLGDSYATSAGSTDSFDPKAKGRRRNKRPATNGRGEEQTCGDAATPVEQPNRMRQVGLKPKDLVGIPWMVAIALRADGWYLRSDIIWAKPNPMPESMRDRPTKAHEYLFLLAKNERYFYDGDAIREPASVGVTKMPDGWDSGNGSHGSFHKAGRERGKGNARTFRGGGAYTGGQSFGNGADVDRDSHGNQPNECGTRNKRSVWTVATAPFPEAHFATFPPDLIEPCVLAGSRVGDCVLDPFSGSGTTGEVALSHQRDYVGIERSAEYVEMSRRRLAKVAPMFAREESELDERVGV